MSKLCFLEISFNPDWLILYQAKNWLAGLRVFSNLQFHITDNTRCGRVDGRSLKVNDRLIIYCLSGQITWMLVYR